MKVDGKQPIVLYNIGLHRYKTSQKPSHLRLWHALQVKNLVIQIVFNLFNNPSNFLATLRN
jgi:hypothetical protein